MGAGPEHAHGQRGGAGRRAGLLLLERLAGDRGPGARRAGSGPGSAAQHLNAAGRRTDGEAGTKQAA